MNSNFKSGDLNSVFGRNTSYASKTPYHGINLALGYDWQVMEKLDVDLFSRFLWSRQEGDRIGIAGLPMSFKAVDSHRWRNAARLTYEVMPGVTPYIGTGFEYEFSGKARSKAMGFALDAPSLRGGTGIGEIGLTYKTNGDSGLCLSVGAQGYLGRREGATGNFSFAFSF